MRHFSNLRARLDTGGGNHTGGPCGTICAQDDCMCARLVLLLLLCTVPSPASAQPWADAYKAGDYQKTADLLHPLVIQLSMQPEASDPEPARHLALLYGQGLGLARDPILACALAQLADRATQNLAPQFADKFAEYDAIVKASARFVTQHCDSLTQGDGHSAGIALSGCWRFGMNEEVLTVGSDSVAVGRRGIRLAERLDGDLDGKPDPHFSCVQVIARVRPITVGPSPDATSGVAPRHCIESLGWLGGPGSNESPGRYVLQWEMYELQGKMVVPVATEQLYFMQKWPGIALPPEFDTHLTIEMIRSGHVRWRMNGAPPKRGWIMLPEEKVEKVR